MNEKKIVIYQKYFRNVLEMYAQHIDNIFKIMIKFKQRGTQL